MFFGQIVLHQWIKLQRCRFCSCRSNWKIPFGLTGGFASCLCNYISCHWVELGSVLSACLYPNHFFVPCFSKIYYQQTCECATTVTLVEDHVELSSI